MGVRGLQTFIEKNDYGSVVNIEKEILAWKTKNPKLEPIIVFNVFGLCCLDEGLLCGGSSHEFDDRMEQFFIRLKKCGAKLVFIQSQYIRTAREEMSKSIERWNNRFQWYVKIYEEIENKKPVPEIVTEMEISRWGCNLSPNLVLITSKYGEYLYGRAGRDCDFGVAYYATKHNAMAVFSVDTDLLIFEGNWKFWNYNDLDFENLTATEYDREAIGELLSITPKQRPLLATLIGNDFTKAYSDELYQFHRRLGRPSDKFRTVADFIRRNLRGGDLSEEVIDLCAVEVFGRCADDDKRQLIRDSVNSYNLESQIEDNHEVDPIEAALVLLSVTAVKNYRKLNIDSIQAISTPFNDMATPECSTVLIDFLVELLRKKMGIVYHDEASERRFKILQKKSQAESFAVTHVTPIRPDYPMPILIDLLTKDDSDDELNKTRWNLLAWMLSISDEHRDALQSMERDFRVTCATLLVLVQKKVLSIKAADGILITEIAVKEKQLLGNEIPRFLEACHVRAAHIYRRVYSDINYGFMTVGLISSTSDLLRFDGVYFQNLMAAKTFPKDLVKAIQFYRIYAN